MAVRLRRAERGQALVELALSLPVLLLLAASVVTLSLLSVTRLATQNAASEGARALALTNDDLRAMETIRAALAPLRADKIEVRISPEEPDSRPRGTLVHVRVGYRVALPLAGPDGVLVQASSARRMEYVRAP